MAKKIQIVEAQKGLVYRDFLEVPFLVQGKNKNWVPPLRIQQKELFNPAKNPFFEHAEMRRFLAYCDGRPSGRLAAIKNDAHNRVHHETTCHFGHYECIDDEDVSRMLFEALEKAAQDWNLNLICGPFNPSINDDLGFLANAYDKPPMIMMPYNPPYYLKQVESKGYEKAMDLYCYLIRQEDMTEKLQRGAEIVRKRSKLVFRKFNMKDFWGDARKIWDLYGKAWEENWCAVPFTKDEFDHLAKNMKSVIDPDFIFIAETPSGEPVGFSLALPNINEAVSKIRNGRLFPIGIFKLLWHTRRGALHSQRIPMMGVLKEYRGRGIDSVFYYDHFIEGVKKGFFRGEMGWILEINTMMNRAAEMMGGIRYKTYRIYQKVL